MTGKKGGEGSKMKKFPRIADYLQVKHKGVWEIFNDAGMLSLLNPRKGTGVTLLLPDSKTVDKYRKVLEGDKPEEVTDWLSSLVISDCITTAKGFETAQNLLGLKLPMDGKSLKGISKMEQDSGFVPFERSGPAKRANMAVWKITGEYPWKEGKEASGGARGRRRFPKKGGVEPEVNLATVHEITDFVNKVFVAESAYVGISNKPSPCMIAVKNILTTWKSTNPQLYVRAISILTVNPVINFCLIFMNAHVFSCSELQPVPYLYENGNGRVEYLALLDRANLPSGLGLKELSEETIHKSADCYKNLDESNSCGNSQNIYPDDLAGVFRAHPGLHRFIDEFKFIMAHYMRDINNCALPQAECVSAWNEMVRVVSGSCGLKHVSCLPANSEACKAFCESRYYIHLPYSKKDIETMEQIYGGEDEEEEDPSAAKDEAPKEEHGTACAFDEETKKCLKEILESTDAEKLKEKLEKLLGE
jgi:hypothetical protein